MTDMSIAGAVRGTAGPITVPIRRPPTRTCDNQPMKIMTFLSYFMRTRVLSGALPGPLCSYNGKTLSFFFGFSLVPFQAHGTILGKACFFPPFSSFFFFPFFFSLPFGHRPRRGRSPLTSSHMDIHSVRTSVCTSARPYPPLPFCPTNGWAGGMRWKAFAPDIPSQSSYHPFY
jgi:hypothetical protein